MPSSLHLDKMQLRRLLLIGYADAGQVAEACLDVERNDLAPGLPCVRSDDEVVGATRFP